MNAQLILIGFFIGMIICLVVPFLYLDNELRIEAIFRRFKRVLQQGVVDILNWLETFRKPNKNK